MEFGSIKSCPILVGYLIELTFAYPTELSNVRKFYLEFELNNNIVKFFKYSHLLLGIRKKNFMFLFIIILYNVL